MSRVSALAFELLTDVKPVDAGKKNVEQQKIDAAGQGVLERGFAIRGHNHVIGLFRQLPRKQALVLGIVFHQQDLLLMRDGF